MATKAQAAPKTLPCVFHADNRYRITLAVFTVLSILGSVYVSAHQPRVGIVFWAMSGLYVLLLAIMLSLKIQIDGDGLLQRWLFSGTRVAWKQVTRAYKTKRSWALFGTDSKELVLLSFLPRTAQETIAKEAISRARLKRSNAAPKPPIIEQWEGKK